MTDPPASGPRLDSQEWLRIWDEPDLEAIRALSTDDLEVTAVLAALQPRYYKGRGAAVQWLTELRERLQGSWSTTELTRVGRDAVVVEGELRMTDPGATGVEVQHFAVMMRLRGDRVRWIGTFSTIGDATEAYDLGVGKE